MRWLWIDRFETFKSGEQACAIKNVSLAEENPPDDVAVLIKTWEY